MRIVLLVATLVAGVALACECRAGAPESQLETADAVFEATVQSISEQGSDWVVKAAVGRRWKGDAKGSFVLRARTGKACGYFFSTSKTYLVFAMREGADLRVTTCGKTTPIESAGDLVAKLGPPK